MDTGRYDKRGKASSLRKFLLEMVDSEINEKELQDIILKGPNQNGEEEDNNHRKQ